MSRGRRSSESPLSLFALQDIITCLMGIMVLVCLFLALQTIGKASAAASAKSELPDVAGLDRERERLEELRNDLLKQIENHQSSQEIVSSLNPIEAAEALQAAQRQNLELKQKVDQLTETIAKHMDDKEGEEAKLEQRRAELSALQEQLAVEERAAELRAMKKVGFLPDQAISKTPYLVECGAKYVRVIELGNNDNVVTWSSEEAESKFAEWHPVVSTASAYFVFMLKPSGVGVGMSLYQISRNAGFDAGYDVLEENATILGEVSR